ncbi:hypothetical protein HMPREF0043_00235 [Actinobaculum sp. oral taxon 183 str. F0552]|nr:hypothetical protein HMPREF0043_00235 [Actinobaculum sp. oral taxon 183 str. F0552]
MRRCGNARHRDSSRGGIVQCWAGPWTPWPAGAAWRRARK